MVNISTFGDSAIKFTFTDSDHYLYGNGEITVPVNSLSLVIDESDMACFKKGDGDTFIAFNIANSNFASKDALISFYKENMVSEGGVPEEEIQAMIASATSGYADSVTFNSDNNYIEFYHDDTKVYELDASDFVIDGMIDDVRIETIGGVSYLVIDFNTASGKQDIQIPLTDIFDPSNYYTKTDIDTKLSGKQDTLSAGTNITISGNVISADANNVVNVTQAEYDALVTGGTVDPTVLYNITDATPIDMSQYWTSAQTDSAITQATSGKVDTSTFETYSGSVETALSGKQDTLSAGTNITIVDNVISAEGGGKAVTGGTNISVTTGETADTINCTLPLTVVSSNSSIIVGNDNNKPYIGVNSYYSVAEGTKGGIEESSSSSHKEGYYSRIKTYALASHVEGYYCSVEYNSKYSHAEGYYTKTTNESEHSSGRYNTSNHANWTFGDSGNTLFSVGNGTADNARHNAFEIRQNGDIYITKDGQDVKLQDNLGSTIEISSAITSGDTNPVQGGVLYDKFDEIEEVTAAALNSLNDNFDGLKLKKVTQAQYDGLISGGTVDNSTLYVVI